MIYVGIDLGGTKIEIIALDEAGQELARQRTPTPQGDYRATLAAIGTLVKRVETDLGARGRVGIGTPGAFSRATGTLKNSNSACLMGRPFLADIEALLGRPVHMENDANCFALSEATDGAGKGAAVVFGVILGTGVGGGIVVHGRMLTGPNAIAGEWGHNPLPWPRESELPGPPCYCGKHGCIETFLSGPAMARDHGARLRRARGISCATVAREMPAPEEDLAPPEIASRADAGDEACLATVERYEERLSRALASVINVLDPDVIVLGGGMSNIERLYERVPRLWGEHVFSDRVDTLLVRARHGDSSGVRGAAFLAMQ